jgi:molybdenum-dependent DNA-binding transcriptional regulator ModE
MQRKDERTLALLRRFSHSAKMVVQHSEGGSEKDIAKMSRYGNNMVARTESIAEMQRTTNEMHAKLDQVDWDEVAENIDWNGIFKDLRK